MVRTPLLWGSFHKVVSTKAWTILCCMNCERVARYLGFGATLLRCKRHSSIYELPNLLIRLTLNPRHKHRKVNNFTHIEVTSAHLQSTPIIHRFNIQNINLTINTTHMVIMSTNIVSGWCLNHWWKVDFLVYATSAAHPDVILASWNLSSMSCPKFNWW